MKRHLAILAGLGGSLIAAPGAPAEFTGISVESKPTDVGIKTCNVYAEFDEPGDHLFACYGNPVDVPAFMSVIGGTFFQHPFFDSIFPPNPALFPIFPTLRYDTFVTIGVKSFNPSNPGVPEGQPEDNLTLSAGFSQFEPTTIDLSKGIHGGGAGWFVTPDDEQGDPFNADFVAGDGRVLVAQLSTVDGDGFEGLLGINYISDGVGHDAVATFTHLFCPWDLDGSGVVAINDLLAVLAAWGDPGGPADFDGSGVVAINDLLELLANKGPCP